MEHKVFLARWWTPFTLISLNLYLFLINANEEKVRQVAWEESLCTCLRGTFTPLPTAGVAQSGWRRSFALLSWKTLSQCDMFLFFNYLLILTGFKLPCARIAEHSTRGWCLITWPVNPYCKRLLVSHSRLRLTILRYQVWHYFWMDLAVPNVVIVSQ